MRKRHGIAAAVAATLVITSTTASADSNLGAFAVGAAVGALINNQVGKNQRKKTTQRRSGVSNYQRQQNREVQAALNGFGFPVGAVDGALGQRSRTAIANYQSYMGYPPSGYLDDYQRNQLVGAHQRLQAGGGAAYPEVVANEGTKGLLKAFNDPTYADRYRGGINNGQQNGVYNNQGAVARAAVGGGQVAGGQDQPLSFAPLAPLNQAPTASMASHCELVAGMTQANQGVILASNVRDPEQALGEQFCEARSFAMTQSQGLAAQSGQTDAQLAAACTQIAEALEPASSQIGSGDVKLVATQAQQVANAIFQGNMATAGGYGQICLGLGYRQDDAKMALGGATAMLAAGQMPYAEVMGHHTRWGFGVTAAPAASISWYQTALSSMEQGAQPVFVPSKTAERNAVIKASISAGAGGGLAPLQAAGNNGGLALPALNLGNN
ncbi:MAG: peptidoglycan-binding domain-containing protein [Pseudomonadota bacterium]